MSSPFSDWTTNDLLKWLDSVKLPENSKNILKNAIYSFGVEGSVLLTCNDEQGFKSTLGINNNTIIAQFRSKLKDCTAYVDAKNKMNNDIIDKKNIDNEGVIDNNNNTKQEEKEKIREEERKKIREEERKKIRDEEREKIIEEEKNKQMQNKNNALSHFKKNEYANKQLIQQFDNEPFFPTFSFEMGATQKDTEQIYPNWKIDRLTQFVKDRHMGNKDGNLSKIDFYFNGHLLADTNKTLKEYGIYTSNHIISTHTRVIGGSNLQLSNNESIRKVDINNKLITITNDADCITFEDSKEDPRALMSCGHAFTAITMHTYIEHCFQNNLEHSEFHCPVKNCAKLWDWAVVAAVADLTDDEFIKYSNIISKRQVDKGELKCCPHCHTYITKPEELNRNCVHCVVCNGPAFCYLCGKKWNHNGFQICGNNICTTYLIEKNIKNCDNVVMKAYSNQIIPQMRACPKCLTILIYEKKCKHIKCRRCEHEFCFGCLVDWPCKETVCKAAPRQEL